MLFAVRVNLDHFIRDLQEGDPFVWAILVGMILCTGVGLYRQYRQWAASRTTGTPDAN